MFQYNGATITARELTIADDDAIGSVILSAIAEAYPQARMGTVTGFGTFVFGAVIDGEPPFPMVTANSTPTDIVAAYAAWLKLPRSFARNWREALDEAENYAPKK